jgi:hypothetical protein
VRILSKAEVKLNPKDNIKQEKKSNDLAYVSTDFKRCGFKTLFRI